MQIFTIDDQDFPELLELFESSSPIGRFTENGQIKFVRANKRLVMVSPGYKPENIAVTPVRTQNEGVTVAKQILELQAIYGRTVTEEDGGSTP